MLMLALGRNPSASISTFYMEDGSWFTAQDLPHLQTISPAWMKWLPSAFRIAAHLRNERETCRGAYISLLQQLP